MNFKEIEARALEQTFLTEKMTSEELLETLKLITYNAMAQSGASEGQFGDVAALFFELRFRSQNGQL